MTTPPAFTRLRVEADREDGVGRVTLARPAKSNAFDAVAWLELERAARLLAAAARGGRVRAVLLDAEGANFCAGLDLSLLRETLKRLEPGGGGAASGGGGGGISGGVGGGNKHNRNNGGKSGTNDDGQGGGDDDDDDAGRRERFLDEIRAMQRSITSFESLPVPVVAAVSGACVGAGVDLIAAADVRLCSDDAFFCVKEVDLAIAADLGSLQRLPALVGLSCAAEWALTARAVPSAEAERRGLVARRCADRAALAAEALRVARLLASKPQRALRGTKRALLRARDRPCVAEGLEAIARENMSALSGSNELRRATRRAGAGGGGGGGGDGAPPRSRL